MAEREPPPTKEQLDREVEALRKTDPNFIESEYRKHRRKGIPASRIDYDMDHIWR